MSRGVARKGNDSRMPAMACGTPPIERLPKSNDMEPLTWGVRPQMRASSVSRQLDPITNDPPAAS